MASAEELSFKVQEAKQWKKDVEAELEMVNNLLKQVSEEVKTEPYEDDTIMKGLKSVGEALASSFETLGKNFSQAVLGIDPIIGSWQKTITGILERLAEATKNIGTK